MGTGVIARALVALVAELFGRSGGFRGECLVTGAVAAPIAATSPSTAGPHIRKQGLD